jgi:glycosyltransferase involved in cell wall biosynthesis
VVCEALRIGLPVLASRIPGNIGLLGSRYPGYFPVEDERALARLIERAVRNEGFYSSLKKEVQRRRPLVAPRQEARALLAALD